ncbi:hypothetical protein HC928_09360 [bacterium]|nr:hypothetical protein [bacterium]
MHALTSEEFQQIAEPVLRQVFVGNNDQEPFLPHIEERLLLYCPRGGVVRDNKYWERQRMEALCQAAQLIGDTGFYLAILWEQPTAQFSTENHYAYIPLSELVDALAALPGSRTSVEVQLNMPCRSVFGSCLCPTSGRWGMLIYLDDYGFLGGTSEFMKAVRHAFPEIDEEVLEFLHFLNLEYLDDVKSGLIRKLDNENIDPPWLKQLLTHVYGSSKAEQLLAENRPV